MDSSDKLITSVPSASDAPEVSIGREDTDYDNIDMSKLAQLTLHPGEDGIAAGNAFSTRAKKHDELMGFINPNELSTDGASVISAEDSAALLFSNDTKPLDNTIFNALSIPEAPAGVSPYAVVVSKAKDGRASVSLFGKDDRGFVDLTLLDQGVKSDSADINPQWTPGGLGFQTHMRVGEVESKESDGFFKFELGEANNEAKVSIIRPPLTVEEKIATSDRNFNMAAKRAKKGKVATAVAAIAMGALSVIPNGSADDSRIGERTYEQLTNIDDEAKQATAQAIDLFNSENVQGLEELLTGTHFEHTYVSVETYESIAAAQNFTEIENEMNEKISSIGIDSNFRIPIVDTDKFQALSDGDLGAAKAGAEGVLDYLNEFAPLIDPNVPVDLEIVHGVYPSDIENDHEFNGGHYDPVDSGNDRAIIRISAGTTFSKQKSSDAVRAVISSTTAHEIGHHIERGTGKNIGVDSQSVTYMNPPKTAYDEESNQAFEGFSSLRVGSEIQTAYAGTNPHEDMAEILEAMIDSEIPDMSSENGFSILENKFAAVLADLEEEIPGIAAKVLLRQSEVNNQPPSVIEKIAGVADDSASTLRTNSSRLMLAFGLSTLLFSYRQRKNKMNAGVKKRASV